MAMVLSNAAWATVSNDRLYLFGDDPAELAAANTPVGSGAGAGGATFDSAGVPATGTLLDLLALSNGGGALPQYVNVAGGGPVGTRPGAPANSLGIRFDGTDDFLSGFALGFPPITKSSNNTAAGGIGNIYYGGIQAKGFQLWVYPESGGPTANQHIVMDTTQQGLRINGTQEWAMVYPGTEIDSNRAVTFDQWAHVMVAIPRGPATPTGSYTSVMYLNGEAIAANTGNYSNDPTVNTNALSVGAATGLGGAVGTANWFKGTVDELRLFVWGRGYNPSTGSFTDFGTFSLLSDNDWMLANRSQVPGDISNNGSRGQEDVNAMVAGWLKTKTVNNIRVGDKDTYAQGDLNFDGITNLADVQIMVGLIGGSGSGSGSGIDISPLLALGVPEPTSVLLAIAALGCGAAIAGRRRRRNC
jgi:hypothetical protein